jgi:hypothetical protein
MGARREDHRFREEIEEHIALQTIENLRANLPHSEARRQAVLKFGAVGAVREDYQAEQGLPFIENLLQGLRFASMPEAQIAGIHMAYDAHPDSRNWDQHRDIQPHIPRLAGAVAAPATAPALCGPGSL